MVIQHIESMGQQLDHSRIDRIVSLHENLKYYARKINFGGSWANQTDKVSQGHLDKLHKLCDFFIDNDSQIKLRFIRNKCFIYTNNLELSQQLDQLNVCDEIIVSEVSISRPKNTVTSRYPGYQLRVYFKPSTITEFERENIVKFIENNVHELKMNVGMERFYDGKQSRGRYLRLRDYYFIDLRDQRLASVLELTCPGVIRKTVDIIYDDK